MIISEYSSKRILIAATHAGCHNSYECFAQAMEDYLTVAGAEVRYLRSYDDQEVKKAREFCPNEIIGINSDFAGTQFEGRPIAEYFGAPFHSFILDHPLYHHNSLRLKLPDYHVSCLDRYHADYVRRYYPHIQTVDYDHILLHKGLNASTGFEDRKKRLLFCGTLEDSKPYLDVIHSMPEEMETICLDTIDRISAICPPTARNFQYGQEYEKAFLDGLQKSSLSLIKGFEEKIPLYFSFGFAAEAYLRTSRRLSLIKALIKADAPIDIFTPDIQTLLPVAANKDNVKLLPAISYKQYMDISGLYQYHLHIDPGFTQGIHDRELVARLNGALLIKDTDYETTDQLIQTCKNIIG